MVGRRGVEGGGVFQPRGRALRGRERGRGRKSKHSLGGVAVGAKVRREAVPPGEKREGQDANEEGTGRRGEASGAERETRKRFRHAAGAKCRKQPVGSCAKRP